MSPELGTFHSNRKGASHDTKFEHEHEHEHEHENTSLNAETNR